MLTIEQILLLVGILLILSILASKVSSRFGIPSLLVFLILGMLSGSEGPGGIHYRYPYFTQSVGVVALIFILFAGGLSTRWSNIRPVLGAALGLSTVGVVITALAIAWFTTMTLGFTWYEGLLLGAVVSSTDAAAVFSILHGKNVGLKGHLIPLLELESGCNDPTSIFLTVALIHVLQTPGSTVWPFIPLFLKQMALGGVMGYIVGRLAVVAINSSRLEYDGLYPVLTIALVTLLYGLTAGVGGSGFLAVYVAAMVVGNSDFIHKKSLIRFHDGLAWLMQIIMFLTLGLLVFPSHVFAVTDQGLIVSLFLIFAARPLAVFLTLIPSRLNYKEKLLVAWVGLRGAVPIILATFPLLAGVPKAELFFNIVFFIVLTSVLLQGTSIPLFIKWLKLAAPFHTSRPAPLEMVSGVVNKNDLVEIPVPEGSSIVGKQIVNLGLPHGVLVVFITRGEESIVPTGGTILEAGDILLVLADKESLSHISATIQVDTIAS